MCDICKRCRNLLQVSMQSGKPVASATGARAAASSRGKANKMTPAGTDQLKPSYCAVYVGKDPRPSTKAFTDRCIGELFDFLAQNNYPHPVTLKQLNQPSSNDFRKIFEFLFSFLKPGFKLGQKLEDEIPALLKLVGYPFTIPKSHLQTIGVQHTWLTLLNVLSWLCNSIQASRETNFEQMLLAPSKDGIVGKKKMFLDYANEAYKKFLTGSDNYNDALENYQKNLAAHAQCSKDTIDSLTEERDKNKKILDELMAQPDELSSVQTLLESIEIESAKNKRYQVAMEAHLKEGHAELHRLDEEEAEQIAKLGELEAEQQSRMSVLKSQKEADVNFPRLMHKLTAVRRQLPIIEKENQEIDDEIQRTEDELEQEKEEVETMIRKFNRLRMELIPERDDMDMKLEIIEGEKLRVKVNRAQWSELKATLNHDFEKCHKERIDVKVERDDCEDVLQQHESKKARLLNLVAEIDQRLRTKKEAHQRKMLEYQSQIEALKGRHGLQVSDVADAKKRRNEEELAFQELKEKMRKDKEKFIAFLKEAMRFMLEHKKKIQVAVREELNQMEKAYENVLGSEELE